MFGKAQASEAPSPRRWQSAQSMANGSAFNIYCSTVTGSTLSKRPLPPKWDLLGTSGNFPEPALSRVEGTTPGGVDGAFWGLLGPSATLN
jgi:hypothetical protein